MVELIKTLCNEHNMSLKDLEQETGIGKNSIYKWDRQSPAVKYVTRVAQYFAVSVDYLIGNECSMPDEESSLIAKFRLLDQSQKDAVMVLVNGFLAQEPVKKDSKIS